MKTDLPETGKSRFPNTKTTLLTVFIFAAVCVAMRILGCWLLRNENNGDLAIVQMMVRSIITGEDFPVFFYGQAYMGSLEPFTNALTHALFGLTNFGTEIGTAIYTLLSVFFACRLAKRAGGMTAAAFTLFFCMCGPTPFFHYAVSPRGGYGVLLFVTTGVLDLAADMVCRERNSRRYSSWLPFFFGFLVGIGFWNNQLCAPAVVAGAMCIVFCAPKLLARLSLWTTGFAGFVSGSLPFWLWNLANGWESFGMSESISLDPYVAAPNSVSFVSERWGQLLGLDTSHAAPSFVLYIIWAASVIPLLVLPAVYLKKTITRLAAGNKSRHLTRLFSGMSNSSVTALLLFFYFITFFACFILSHFAVFKTPRYLLPLVPLIGVATGMAFTLSEKKTVKMLVAVSVAVVVCWQFYGLKFFFAMSGKHNALSKRNEMVVEYLSEHNVDSVYCAFSRNTLNLAGGGSIVFSDKHLERVPAFRRKLETADSPAVLDDFMGIASWAKASGGSVSSAKIGGIRVATDLTPPAWPVRELASSCWLSVTNSAGLDVMPALADRNKSTYMRLVSADSANRTEGKHTERVVIAFKNPERLSGIRIFASAFPFAESLSVSFRSPGRERYVSAEKPVKGDPACVWSGPRYYPTRHRSVRDIRFAPVETDSVMIEITGKSEMVNAVIYGIQTLAPLENNAVAATLQDWKTGVGGLMDVLSSNAVTRLYATRWVANRVYELSDGGIWTNHGSDLTPKITGLPAASISDSSVFLDSTSAILLPEAECPAMRDVAKVRHLLFREVEIPLLGTLFIPLAVQNVPFGLDKPLGINFENDFVSLVPSCEWMENILADSRNQLSADFVGALYKANPGLVPLMELIVSRPDIADVYLDAGTELDLLMVSEFGLDAVFDAAVTWRGCRILSRPEQMRPGSPLVIRHYWKSRRERIDFVRQKSTMVHIVGPGEYRFQDDYDFESNLGEFDKVDADTGECFWHIDRLVFVPDGAPEGEYEMRLGVYDRMFSTHRLHIGTEAPVTRNAERVLHFMRVE